jgi:predicted alpha/beta-hydrolase family hydrolase
MAALEMLVTGPDNGPLLLLAHGAGAQMDSSFMESFAALMAKRGIGVARFEFPYMAARRAGGKKRPPPKAESMQPSYLEAVAQCRASHPERPLFIGGKSMGGRIASLVADEVFARGECLGLVCLGYPFHPPNVPDKPRTAHLLALQCPALIVQGERDPFGPKTELLAFVLAPSISFHWAGDGDHDFGPRGGSGFTRKGNLAAAADAVAVFVAGRGTSAL